jgi:protease-4
MVIDAETIIDRKRLRRKLSFWRIVTFLVLAGLILALVKATGIGELLSKKSQDHIARVKISGVITNDRPLLKLLGELKKKDNVKAVILDISSPGGSTVGGEAIYEAVRQIAEKKPVATSVGTLAASAGYMIASASDHIVARRSSIVGSIGVIFQYADASILLEKIGVAVKEIKSSPMKAEPSPFHTTSEEAKEMINRLVRDSYDWFVDLVAKRRNISKSDALKLADGSIFSGSQGLANKLVDAIGDETTVKNWMVKEKGISKDLKIISWKPDRPEDGIFENPAGLIWVFKQFGLNISPNAANELSKRIPGRLFLDGLVSMWLNSGNLIDNEAMMR